MIRLAVASGLAIAGLALPASAEFITPDADTFGWDRGATGLTTYAEWDYFTSPSGPNRPDVGSFLGDTLAVGASAFNVYDSNFPASGSFITGGGNIYSPSGVIIPRIEFGGFGLGEGFVTTILLQVRTLGTEFDVSSMLLNGTVAPTSIVELDRIELGGFGGYQVDSLIRFDVVGSLASNEISFEAMESSMSLDRVAIDTFTTAVPAPGAVALAVLAALGGATSRRRHG